jgi:two-component system response regulator PilR (NtrC family)
MEMSPELQVKLMRVLQERTIRHLGDTREIPIDVRVIAATNKPLQNHSTPAQCEKIFTIVLV